MKKTLIILASLMVLASGTVTTSSAEDIAGRSGLGIGLGYISPKDDTIDSGMLPSINYTYGVTSNFSLELSLGRAVLDVEDEDISGLNLGEITTVPLQLTAQYRIPSGSASPYLGAGVGYYFNDFDTSDEAVDFLRTDLGDPSLTAKIEADDSFGYHVNLGVDYFFNRNLAINLDARYFWTEVDGTLKGTVFGIPFEGDLGELELDSSVVSAGIKYFF